MRAAMFVLAAALAFPSAGTRANHPPKGWEFVGRTQAAATVDLRARVSGNLTRVVVREGDAVAKGDLLAAADEKGFVAVIDLKTGKIKQEFKAEEQRARTSV